MSTLIRDMIERAARTFVQAGAVTVFASDSLGNGRFDGDVALAAAVAGGSAVLSLLFSAVAARRGSRNASFVS